MIAEHIGPYDGGWRVARKPFRCGNWRGGAERFCQREITSGELYYDTCEGEGGSSPFRTIRVCNACATQWKQHANPVY